MTAVGEERTGANGDHPGVPCRPYRTRPRPTLTSIARAAGVSVPTVSKVVNGRADVAPATRAMVERLLTERDYPRPARRWTGLVDLVFTDPPGSRATPILRGVAERCAERGWGVAVAVGRPAAAGHDTSGVIVAATEPSVGQWPRPGMPLVVVDPVLPPGPRVPSVGTTDRAGALAATDHLLISGHRRIAVLGGPSSHPYQRERIDGYRTALERAGVAADPALIRYGDDCYESGVELAGRLLDLDDPPTAILAGSDQRAFGVYEAARRRGWRVPRDLSVVGFGDIPGAGWVSPPLTTVRQPLPEMGRVAVDILISILDGRPPRTRRVELPTELIVRESTASPR